ncbi:hypothetical protein A2V68_02530 [candidate division Kazan bacterium RBG_13_50_9]|uniref:DUF11 domain-containing protein n=1 Tax=candidate division Kazan bacterium RBG_13_50_9 TaxID=1798535 RepID=A0A1F4NRM6_UNCK3|nr:MAG: hypothetical protein A2V68_02530 [candidate division Kazan bacterium RBG_13_50_9]
MPKLVQDRFKRFISHSTTAALILQMVLVGGLFNSGILPAWADESQTWHFTASGDYDIGVGVTVADTYAFSNLEYTPASDNLDSYGPTTDLVETDTAGRILAGTSTVYTYPSPYSTDYGVTWNKDLPIIMGGEISNIKFAKVTNGGYSGRIIGVGFDDGTPIPEGGWCYTDDDGATWTGHDIVAGSTKWEAAYYDPIRRQLWAGTDDASNLLYYSTDFGASFTNTDVGSLTNATEVLTITSSGPVLYAGAIISGATGSSTAIFYSLDNGQIWSEATNSGNDSTHDTIYDIKLDSLGYVYAVTDGAYILKSTAAVPGATTFQKVSISGLSGAQTMYIDASDGIFVIGTGGANYRSFDYGTDFVGESPANSVVDMLYTHAIIRMSNYIYLLATEGAGSSGNAYSGDQLFIIEIGGGPTVAPADGEGVDYSSISVFSETYAATSETQGGLQYRLTNSYGGDWYWWDGVNWSVSADQTESNTALEVNLNIAQFDEDVGTGTFYFQVALFDTGVPYNNASIALDSVDITYVGNTLTVTAPDTSTDWDIGDTESITWDITGETPDHYDIFYAQREDEGAWGSWLQSNANMDDYTTSGTGYRWEIPVVSYPHPTYKNYKVKVESYTSGDVLLAEDESDAFIIDFGPINNFVVEVPESATVDSAFPATVTARDQYNNTITNFDNTVNISANPGPITPTTIGDGTYGSWSDGTASYDGYVISVVASHSVTASYSGASGSDTINILPKGGGGGGDTEKPTSKVIGVLEGGKIVPMKKLYTRSPISIVAEAQDDSKMIKSVELWYRHKESGKTYQPYGPGTKIFIEDIAYWKWDFDIKLTGGDGTYYFYSIATDYAGNVEDPPGGKGYDATTTFQATRPKIWNTNPYNREVEVGVQRDVIVSFDKPMDGLSVQEAFCFSKNNGNGSSIPPCEDWSYWGWGLSWSQRNTVATFSHSRNFDYATTYKVLIDPTKAMDVNGLYLDPASDVPNPWIFTTTVPQDPDLSNSSKIVEAIYDGGTGLLKDEANPGDILLYSITLTNTSKWADSNTTLTDPIPLHTTYGNYLYVNPPSFNVRYDSATNSILGSGLIPKNTQVVVKFQVRIDSPLPNETEVKNTATVNDGNGREYYPFASTLVKSSPNWADSRKDANQDTAKVGATLTYTISVKNSGDMDAENVTITDRIPTYTQYVQGSATGGLEYDGVSMLSWQGAIKANESPKIFTFKVIVTSQPPPNNPKVINIAIITDENGSYNRIAEVTIIPDDSSPPYITAVSPAEGTMNVKLFSPVTITFSGSMIPDSLEYRVSAKTGEDETGTPIYEVIYDTTEGDSDWTESWASDSGKANAKVTITPSSPLCSPGIHHLVKVISAKGANGKYLVSDKEAPVPYNEWGFTTLSPALIFEQPATLWLQVDKPSGPIVVKLVNWTNYENPDAPFPQYEPYAVEDPKGLTVRLMTTNLKGTGKFDVDPSGKFNGSITSVLMPQGADRITFYFRESSITSGQYPPYRIIVGPASNTGYTVFGSSRPYVSTADGQELTGDQIAFKTTDQNIPVGKLSEPLRFGVYSADGQWVTLKGNDAFLLDSSSPTGQFYNRLGNPISEFATFGSGEGIKQGYLLRVDQDRVEDKFYYKELMTPGYYTINIEDIGQLNISGVNVAAGGRTLAEKASQDILIMPLEELEELEEEELEEVVDETGRELDYIAIDPEDTIVLPGAIQAFTAQGFDTENKEIEELKFSWYVIRGGGTILKKGSDGNGHTTNFTAGLKPGVYTDTVLVATLYNGKIQAALATVRVADVVDYGGPGRLPSTGPNGIQLLFISLTLLSAVALAAVEHYEKTQLAETTPTSPAK